MFRGRGRPVTGLARHENDGFRHSGTKQAGSWLPKRPARSAVYTMGTAAILHFSRISRGDACMIIIAILAVILIPVAGFTLNQMALTRAGRRFARTVDEITILKESDARAFTRPLAALIGKWRHRDSSGKQRLAESRIAADKPRASIETPDVLSAPGPAREAAQLSRSSGYPPAEGFWGALTVAEQDALVVRAWLETFPAGTVLWRQGQRGDHVLVIVSGRTRIYREDERGKQFIAIRGPGDVVGERAALRVESRSATVAAVEVLRALVLTTADFITLATEHPRVVTVLESEIYARLAESRPAVDEADGRSPAPSGPGAASLRWTDQNCTICLTDITAFSDSFRTDDDRLTIRAAMYQMLTDAFNDSGVPWLACHREDRGDGVLIVIPPSVSTGLVVETVVTRLTAALQWHNRRALAATRIQLRVSIHVGPVTTDAEGVSGHAINQAARLIEAAAVKSRIAETGADLAFVTSESVYDTVISPKYGPADLARYREIPVSAKNVKGVARMLLAGPEATARGPGAAGR